MLAWRPLRSRLLAVTLLTAAGLSSASGGGGLSSSLAATVGLSGTNPAGSNAWSADLSNTGATTSDITARAVCARSQ